MQVVTTKIPLGHAYPEEVRGKEFKTTHTVQVRTCTECGKMQSIKMSATTGLLADLVFALSDTKPENP